MASMMSLDPSTHHMMEETKRHMQAPPEPKAPEPPTADQMLELLHHVILKLAKKITIWNETSSHKLKSFKIYGYEVKGTNLKNATKRLRKLQAECNLLPGTTSKDLAGELKRLKALTKKK